MHNRMGVMTYEDGKSDVSLLQLLNSLAVKFIQDVVITQKNDNSYVMEISVVPPGAVRGDWVCEFPDNTDIPEVVNYVRHHSPHANVSNEIDNSAWEIEQWLFLKWLYDTDRIDGERVYAND